MSIVTRAVDRIWKDLMGRKGIRQALEEIDEGIQQEIRDSMQTQVDAALQEWLAEINTILDVPTDINADREQCESCRKWFEGEDVVTGDDATLCKECAEGLAKEEGLWSSNCDCGTCSDCVLAYELAKRNLKVMPCPQ